MDTVIIEKLEENNKRYQSTKNAFEAIAEKFDQAMADYFRIRLLYDDEHSEEKRKVRKARKEQYKNLKFAFIRRGKQTLMCFVDNKTGKAYHMNGDRKPMIDAEIKYFGFDRWCTHFDL